MEEFLWSGPAFLTSLITPLFSMLRSNHFQCSQPTTLLHKLCLLHIILIAHYNLPASWVFVIFTTVSWVIFFFDILFKKYCFPLWFITVYWIELPVLYIRTLLFIYSKGNNLHLPTPNSQSIPLFPYPLGNHRSILYESISLL